MDRQNPHHGDYDPRRLGGVLHNDLPHLLEVHVWKHAIHVLGPHPPCVTLWVGKKKRRKILDACLHPRVADNTLASILPGMLPGWV